MGKLIEIKTEHIGAIRSLFELLKDVFDDVNIECIRDDEMNKKLDDNKVNDDNKNDNKNDDKNKVNMWIDVVKNDDWDIVKTNNNNISSREEKKINYSHNKTIFLNDLYGIKKLVTVKKNNWMTVKSLNFDEY